MDYGNIILMLRVLSRLFSPFTEVFWCLRMTWIQLVLFHVLNSFQNYGRVQLAESVTDIILFSLFLLVL